MHRKIWGVSLAWPWPYLYARHGVSVVDINPRLYGCTAGDYLALFANGGWDLANGSFLANLARKIAPVAQAELEVYSREVFAVGRLVRWAPTREHLRADDRQWAGRWGASVISNLLILEPPIRHEAPFSGNVWDLVATQELLWGVRRGYRQARPTNGAGGKA